MAQIPRASVVSILKALLVTEEELARQAREKSAPQHDPYHDGRVSGLRTALEVLDMDEDAPVSGSQ